MVIRIVDLLGNALNIGDKVAFGETSSTNNAYLCAGEIVDIEDCGKKLVKVHVKITRVGRDSLSHKIGTIRSFNFPRFYSNLVKI